MFLNVDERTCLHFLENSVVWPTHFLTLDKVRFSNSPGLPCAPYQPEPSPLTCSLSLPSIHTHTHTNTQMSLPFLGPGRGWDRVAIPVSGRSGSGSKSGFRFGSALVSWAGNIPQGCQCQPVPSSIHWPHFPAFLAQRTDGALIRLIPGLKTLGQHLVSYNFSPCAPAQVQIP